MKILLRSGWQTINIGDIGITPGMLRLIERHLPNAEVTLELFQENESVRGMIQRAFPQVRILSQGFPMPERGEGKDGAAPSEEYVEAMREADLFLYSSGPIFSYGRNNFSWDLLMRLAYPCFLAMDSETPWGCYGQSFDRFAPPSEYFYRDFLSRADFLYCRDTDSEKRLREMGVRPPVLDFAPDATFAFDLRDEAGAAGILSEFGLEKGKFLVVIAHGRAGDDLLGKMAQIIEHWIAATGLPVLLCPEVTHNLTQHREKLLPRIAPKARKLVHSLDRFWLPDEAATLYREAGALFSGEMHSVILALAAGTPAVLFRLQATGDAADALAYGYEAGEHIMSDGLKGRMMSDLGLDDWLVYHSERSQAGEVASRLINIIENPAATSQTMAAFKARLEILQTETMQTVAATAGKALPPAADCVSIPQ